MKGYAYYIQFSGLLHLLRCLCFYLNFSTNKSMKWRMLRLSVLWVSQEAHSFLFI